MTISQLLLHGAQWLNEYALWIMVAAAALACAAEWFTNTRRNEPQVRTTTSRWLIAWRINTALLVIALAISWTLAPWLSPLFSQALSAKSGLLVHLAPLGVGGPNDTAHIVLGIFLLDLLTYLMHRAMHAVPLLWRIHQVHHNDADMNASTHFRQHPAQMLLVLSVQLPALWLLGISGASWVLYATISLIAQLWQHSVLGCSVRAERYLSWLLVTPRVHRTHHDQRRHFHDANYGAIFSLWDRLFATVRRAPDELRLGLESPPHVARPNLLNLLLLPFTPKPAAPAARVLAVAPARRNNKLQPKKFHSQHQGKT
ncbi:MAG: sterol desaturase family protein [Casimicrobium sp.]